MPECLADTQPPAKGDSISQFYLITIADSRMNIGKLVDRQAFKMHRYFVCKFNFYSICAIIRYRRCELGV